MIKKYKKKPVTIKAVKYNGENIIYTAFIDKNRINMKRQDEGY